MRGPVWLVRPAFLIRAASLLVPARRREEWMREWLAELYYAEIHQARAHAGEARLMAFASGRVSRRSVAASRFLDAGTGCAPG